jgi:hypothetical protein
VRSLSPSVCHTGSCRTCGSDLSAKRCTHACALDARQTGDGTHTRAESVPTGTGTGMLCQVAQHVEPCATTRPVPMPAPAPAPVPARVGVVTIATLTCSGGPLCAGAPRSRPLAPSRARSISLLSRALLAASLSLSLTFPTIFGAPRLVIDGRRDASSIARPHRLVHTCSDAARHHDAGPKRVRARARARARCDAGGARTNAAAWRAPTCARCGRGGIPLKGLIPDSSAIRSTLM